MEVLLIMETQIIVDSVADIPKELAETLNIEIVPLLVNFGANSFHDGVDISNKEFFELLDQSTELPKTSQVNPGKFIEIFKKHLQQNKSIICITLSSEMSGTYRAAVTAKDFIGSDQIKIVDSKAVTFGEGIIGIQAARLAKKGLCLNDIYEETLKNVENLKNYFIVDTLEYLKKGGRLTTTEAFIGNMLKIKPILSIEAGKLIPVQKVRGRKKAVDWVLKQIQSDDLDNRTVGIYHAQDEQYMKHFKTQVQAIYQSIEIIESEVGAVVGTHSGPGCIAISYIAR
jgi:DegV family protein with EDD domain